MNNIKQALESAIEILTRIHEEDGIYYGAVEQCKAALAELEKCEPVAETAGNSVKWLHKRLSNFPCGIKLYTSPPQQQWVGLSDDEIDKMWEFYRGGWYDFAMAIEAKLKELNT